MNPSLFRLSTFETGQFAHFEEIICFVADGNYSVIYLSNGRTLLVSKCLERLQQHLPPNFFLRIHKSYLINPSFVECVLEKQIRLTNGNVYSVSRRKWRQTRLHFMKIKR